MRRRFYSLRNFHSVRNGRRSRVAAAMASAGCNVRPLSVSLSHAAAADCLLPFWGRLCRITMRGGLCNRFHRASSFSYHEKWAGPGRGRRSIDFLRKTPSAAPDDPILVPFHKLFVTRKKMQINDGDREIQWDFDCDATARPASVASVAAHRAAPPLPAVT